MSTQQFVIDYETVDDPQAIEESGSFVVEADNVENAKAKAMNSWPDIRILACAPRKGHI